MTVHVFEEKGLCRVRGLRGVFRIIKFDLVRGEAILWGGTASAPKTRYVATNRLLPARPTDTPPAGFAR